MSQNADKIINFKELKELNSFASYLSIISFSQLIDETHLLIQRLEEADLSKDDYLPGKVQMVLKEFTKRLEDQSFNSANSISKMCSELEKKTVSLYY